MRSSNSDVRFLYCKTLEEDDEEENGAKRFNRLLFAEVFVRVVLVFVVLPDNWTIFAYNSDVRLPIFVVNQYFVGLQFAVQVHHNSHPMLHQVLVHVGIVQASRGKQYKISHFKSKENSSSMFVNH